MSNTKDELIVHLSAAGVPTTWSVTALYRNSYGIARNAARSWYERSVEGREGKPDDSPQFLCQIEGGAIVRKELWLGDHHLSRQVYDRTAYLVQFHTSPCDLSEKHRELITEALHFSLVEIRYFIPREEWERRYPAQLLITKRFSDFNAAYDVHRNSGAEGRMPFEARWAMMMEAPEGYVPAYGIQKRDDEHVIRVTGKNGEHDFQTWNDGDEALQRCRLLNSGWSADEVDILMKDEPLN